MPCDYSLYPDNWKDIRASILKRAAHCCASQDLKPYRGNGHNERTKHMDLHFCSYCGQVWRSESFTDAAGSHDWDFVRVDIRLPGDDACP